MIENNEWQWSNFSWYNYSIPDGTIIGWRIYYIDTSKNINCTDIMSFTILEDSPPVDTIYVDDDADLGWYDATHVRAIQEGINNASADYTVSVYDGTYYENVVVDKTIYLIGENKGNTIIDGSGSGDVVKIIH